VGPVHLDSVLASIPSPSSNTIGPFNLYGLCIALGVIAAVWIASKRWEARGGDPDDISTIALWAVPAGVVGARLYHVATDWKLYRDDWVDAFKITQGGLGIPGGIIGGVVVAIVVVRVKKLPMAPLFDVVAPALPVAQAIGRFGNWFNQEVFGRPTSLPWGLEIDEAHRPPAYASESTFHPTFLYEALWNLAVAGLVVVLGRKRRLPPGHLFTVYVLGYALGRLWVENLRSDHASLVLGLRINLWMSLVIAAVALAVLLVAIDRAPAVIPESAYRNTAPAPVAGGGSEADREDGGAGPTAEVEADAGAPGAGAAEPGAATPGEAGDAGGGEPAPAAEDAEG